MYWYSIFKSIDCVLLSGCGRRALPPPREALPRWAGDRSRHRWTTSGYRAPHHPTPSIAMQRSGGCSQRSRRTPSSRSLMSHFRGTTSMYIDGELKGDGPTRLSMYIFICISIDRVYIHWHYLCMYVLWLSVLISIYVHI